MGVLLFDAIFISLQVCSYRLHYSKSTNKIFTYYGDIDKEFLIMKIKKLLSDIFYNKFSVFLPKLEIFFIQEGVFRKSERSRFQIKDLINKL